MTKTEWVFFKVLSTCWEENPNGAWEWAQDPRGWQGTGKWGRIIAAQITQPGTIADNKHRGIILRVNVGGEHCIWRLSRELKSMTINKSFHCGLWKACKCLVWLWLAALGEGQRRLCVHVSALLPTFSSQCSEDKGRDRLLSFNYTSIIPHFIFTTEKIKARLHSPFATAFKLDLIKTSFLEHPPFLSPATETFTCVRKCTVGF